MRDGGYSQVRTLDETIIGLVDHTSRILSCRVASAIRKRPSEAHKDSASTSNQGRAQAGQNMMVSRRCRRNFEVRNIQT